jgi:hypothetical protein
LPVNWPEATPWSMRFCWFAWRWSTLGVAGLRHDWQGECGENGNQQARLEFHLLLLLSGMGQPHAQSNAGAAIQVT